MDESKVKTRNLGFNLVPGLVSGKVDAILGGFWNVEGIELAQQHRHPRIIRVNQAGVPTYNELVLVANQDALDREGKSIRSFIGALARPPRRWTATRARAPTPCCVANPDLDPKLQRAVGQGHAAPLPAGQGKPFAYQDPHAVAGLRRLDARQPPDHPHPRRHRRLRQPFLPGAGL